MSPEHDPNAEQLDPFKTARMTPQEYAVETMRVRGGGIALRQLAELAIDIALGAPLDRRTQPGHYTYVSRDTVREIRRVLDAAGVPWKQQHKELRRK